jgi:hypothetical protein
MIYEKALQQILKIEQQFDVSSVTCKDLRVWPLVRLALMILRDNPSFLPGMTQDSQPMATEKTLFQDILSPYLYNLRLHQKQIEALKQIGEVDFLFFSRNKEEHTEKLGNHFYNRFLDPIIESIKGEFSFLKVELEFLNDSKLLSRKESTIFLNPAYCLNKFKLLNQSVGNSKNHQIENFNFLQKNILEITGYIKFSESYFLSQIELLQLYRDFFTDVLLAVRPKVVFLVCYYYIVGMALAWACRNLGIPSVDVQHGVQGRYHQMYTHWTRIPATGYELLPDFFWSWSQKCKNDILEGCEPRKKFHLPIVGGNPWLEKWVKADYNLALEDQNFLESLRSIDKVILVSLGWWSDAAPIPQLLIDAMKKSSSNWLWLTRLHPLQRDYKEQIRTALQEQDIRHFEIDYATACPLYALLKRCDFHVTPASSVCYEAQAFNVPTVLIHPSALEYYEEYIQQGVFAYAQSGDELLSLLHQPPNRNQIKPKQPYIEADRKLLEQALEVILMESVTLQKSGRFWGM